MHGDERGLVGDGCADVVGPDHAFGINLHACAGEALFFEELDRVHDGRVFDFAHDEVIALALVGVSDAFDGEVGRFRAVRGDDDVVGRLGVNERGVLRARFGQRIAHAQAVLVER